MIVTRCRQTHDTAMPAHIHRKIRTIHTHVHRERHADRQAKRQPASQPARRADGQGGEYTLGQIRTCTCLRRRTRIRIYIHTYIHTYTRTHMHTCAHTCTRAHTHAHVHTYIHTYTYHTYIHTHTHVCGCIHTYIHTNTHVCGCRDVAINGYIPSGRPSHVPHGCMRTHLPAWLPDCLTVHKQRPFCRQQARK